MTIDWWTIGLQTVNAAILIWLLARFLFRPVTRMIADRQAATDAAFDQAEAARAEARAARDEAAAARESLAAERNSLMAQAREEAEREKKRLAEETRAELETLRKTLLDIRGLGPWSVHYALLRGYAWMDGSLHGDVAVRRAIQQLQGDVTPPTAREAETWLADFRPWRSLLAAHLWKSLSLNA